jgi:hypothetical protein
MTTFTVNPEEIANLAAEKLADEVADKRDIAAMASKIILARIDEMFASTIKLQIDVALSARLEEAMTQTINPVNIWGEPIGEQTSIRDQLNARAKEFWTTPVDSSGNAAKPDQYAHAKQKTRAEWMLGKIVSEKFAEEVKQNAVNILAIFKEKIRADGHAALDKHLDELVRVKSR